MHLKCASASAQINAKHIFIFAIFRLMWMPIKVVNYKCFYAQWLICRPIGMIIYCWHYTRKQACVFTHPPTFIPRCYFINIFVNCSGEVEDDIIASSPAGLWWTFFLNILKDCECCMPHVQSLEDFYRVTFCVLTAVGTSHSKWHEQFKYCLVRYR